MNATLANSRAELIKEVRYRATYRGTKELDLVCRPLVAALDSLSDEDLAMARELLLANGENSLMAWLVEGEVVPEEWQAAVTMMRDLFKKAAVPRD